MKRIQISLWILVCLLAGPGAASFGQPTATTPYQLKAVFLFNFTQFVEWPAESYTHPDAPFIIGLYGPNVFGRYLEAAVQNEKVNGHPIKVISAGSLADVRQCRMLFIHKTRVQEFFELQNQLKTQRILTVSDAPGFCRDGGMVGFINDKNKIRLQINLEAASGSGLKISSKLLRLAELVAPSHN